MSQKPSVGRIVLYRHPVEAARLRYANDHTPNPFAAIITAVRSDTDVSLTVFAPGSTPEPVDTAWFGTGVGEWSWPERV